MTAAPPKRKRTPGRRSRAADAPADPIADLEAEVDRRERAAARSSLEVFCARYLPEAFDREPGEFHRAIHADLEALVVRAPIEGAERLSAAYAYPRGHGKTTTITLGYLLWVIANWRDMPHFQGKPPFILIVSDTFDQARDRALDLRDQVESNPLLIGDYGPLAPDLAQRRRAQRDPALADAGGRWTNADWTTRDGVRVKAVGAAQKVRGLLRSGRRPSLIVCDDLENDQAVSTEAQRAKLERWFQRALIPTGLRGSLLTLVVGTILHADSLLSRLLSPSHYGGWLKRRYAALYNDAGQPSSEGATPLWPAGWPVEALHARRDEIGSVAFAQEYLNIPIDDESSPFKLEWLDRARNRGRGVPFLYAPPDRLSWAEVCATWTPRHVPGAYQFLVTAWDISVVETEKRAKERDTDYTVGLTLGLTTDDREEVRRIYRARGLTPRQLRDRVIAEHGVVEADAVVIENNAAQKIHQIELTQGTDLPIVGHTTGRQKHSVHEGIPALAMAFELDRIDLCAASEQERKRIDALCAELHGLGVEAHDDVAMALWIAHHAISRWKAKRDKARTRAIGPKNATKASLGTPIRRESRSTGSRTAARSPGAGASPAPTPRR